MGGEGEREDRRIMNKGEKERNAVASLNVSQSSEKNRLVFERLVKNHICSSVPVGLDPLQFAYCSNRSTDDANCSNSHFLLLSPH